MTYPSATRAAAAGAALLAGATLVAACTTGSTGGSGGAGESNPPATPAAPTSSSAPTPLPTVTDAPSTPASTSAAASTSASTAPANTCTDLTVRVLPGGATPGQEIAAITFVNASSKRCSISGYPTVVLLLGGQTLVTATPTSGTVAQAVQLDPGAQAEAQITDHSTCNAHLSDTIEVTAPNGAASGKLTRPFQLRGCTVTVDPVSLSS